MIKKTLPSGVWDNPEPQDQQVYEEFVAVWHEEAFDDSPVLSALNYYGGGSTYHETGSGGVVACGCTQWFDQSEEGIVTTLTIPCADDGYLDTVDGASFDYDSTTVRLGGDGTNNAYQSWFHFCGIEIPAGATIIEAYLTITESTDGTTHLTNIQWSCEETDSATVPTSNADGQARTRTTENQQQPIYTLTWGYGSDQRRTANFIDLLQEVIDRTGWQSGNSITFWADFNAADFFSEDGYAVISANVTTLTVKYTTEDVTELNIDCDGDGVWYPSANFNDNDTTIRVGFEKAAFFHFSNVTIPKDATILLGNVELFASSNAHSAGGFDFHLVDEDDSDVITSYSDGDSRDLTTASVEIEDDLGWGRQRERLDVNAAAVIQEVVDRTGWASGNQMQAVYWFTGNIGDSLNVNAVEAGDSSLRPNLRIMYVKLPYEETGSGGVVTGGESAPSGSSTVIPAGGVVLGSSGDVTQRSDITVDGGVLLAGSSLNTTYMNELTTGGVVIAGEARVPYLYVEEASGGLVVSQPMYENGFTHRTSVTVPAGSVASDMLFYLGVRLNVVSDEFLVTDLNGKVQPHELREVTENDSCLFWRCQLASEQENVFLVYFNMEAS